MEQIDMRANALRQVRTIASTRPARLLAALLAFGALPVSQARPQVTLDVSKITCDQFTGYKITSPNNIALWLHGYFNGAKGNAIIDPQKLKSDSNTLLHYCLVNPKIPVMQAVTNVFGAGKQ
jgi:acid stress chaperone HdeB